MTHLAILTFIGSLLLGWVIYTYGKRCRDCGKWNALVYQNKDFLRTELRERKETYTDMRWKDSHGRETRSRTRTRYVPYNVNVYKKHYQCKYCESYYSQQFEGSNGLGHGAGTTVFWGLIVSGIMLFIGSNKEHENSGNNNQTTNTIQRERNENKPKKGKMEPISKDDSEIENKPQKDTSVKNYENLETRIEPKNEDEKINNGKEIETTQSPKLEMKITEETPEGIRIEYAISMLQRNKSIAEVVDSTFLSKHQVKKLRRNLEK